MSQADSQLGTVPALPQLPQMRSETLGSSLYGILEEAILEHRLTPGQRLHADELAQQFNISRIPVREALRALDANGWIEIRPRHGTYVRQRTDEELADLFEVRCLIEPHAAALAAQRGTEEVFAELDRLVQAGREAAEDDDVLRAAKVNEEFHCAVARCADNLVFSGIAEGVAKRTRFYFSHAEPGRVRESVEEHAELVDALRAGDRESATAIGLAHVTRTRTALARVHADDGGTATG